MLLRLLERADVLIENYKPGAMERWGLGYAEVLAPRFPRLIHCRISGFGGDGPMGGHPGLRRGGPGHGRHVLDQRHARKRADPDRDPAGRPRHRALRRDRGPDGAAWSAQRSGQGQFIDLTLYDAGIALMHPHIPNYVMSGRLPALTGNAHPNICPYDRFPTATVPVFLAIGNDRAFQRLCAELGAPELASDPRFATNGDRLGHRAELTVELAALLAEQDGEALCQRLLAAGVPAGPVRDVAEVWADAHTRHRGMAAEQPGYKGWGLPIKFSRTPGAIARTPPRFGEHGREILAEFGFSEAEIETLATSGVLVEQRRR